MSVVHSTTVVTAHGPMQASSVDVIMDIDRSGP